jgi:hypothetical protein
MISTLSHMQLKFREVDESEFKEIELSLDPVTPRTTWKLVIMQAARSEKE